MSVWPANCWYSPVRSKPPSISRRVRRFLPRCTRSRRSNCRDLPVLRMTRSVHRGWQRSATEHRCNNGFGRDARQQRSEEHTSELQSLMRISYAVFCLKKNNLFYSLFSYYILYFIYFLFFTDKGNNNH